MRKLILLIVFCSVVLPLKLLNAEPIGNEEQKGRYVLEMMEGRAVVNNRVPAMILDSVRGIVWTCQNIQDGQPLWVKADLAKNGDKPMTKRSMSEKCLPGRMLI